MEFVNAFLLATAWAYFGCLILTIFGKPPMVNIKKEHQSLLYTSAWIILMLASLDIFPQYVYALLGVVYSVAAVGSFIGYPQIWAAYWREYPEQGSDAAQVDMAFWDLMIAVLCFMKWTL